MVESPIGLPPTADMQAAIALFGSGPEPDILREIACAPVRAGRYSRHGSAAGASIDNFAEPLPRLAFEPHHLHLGNGGEVGRRRIDLDAGDKRPSSSRAFMLAACSMTFSRDRPRRLLELSGTEAPTLDEETIFVGQRNGLRHDARLLLRSRR